MIRTVTFSMSKHVKTIIPPTYHPMRGLQVEHGTGRRNVVQIFGLVIQDQTAAVRTANLTLPTFAVENFPLNNCLSEGLCELGLGRMVNSA
jgi:hypothetical protein